MTKLESQYQDLKKAFARLKEAVVLPSTIINQDATIKRFEFTFELCWKVMNNIVRQNRIEVYGPKNSFRAAARLGLIDDPQSWFKFLEARNYTVHTYDEKTAVWVYNRAKEFVPYVEELIKKTPEYL
jgi:nucleotidyltransferase substrate binding protein (TIGR01987 family)